MPALDGCTTRLLLPGELPKEDVAAASGARESASAGTGAGEADSDDEEDDEDDEEGAGAPSCTRSLVKVGERRYSTLYRSSSSSKPSTSSLAALSSTTSVVNRSRRAASSPDTGCAEASTSAWIFSYTC